MASLAKICLSIVSHGQGDMVRHLLADLVECGLKDFSVILTLNIPEDEAFLGSRDWPFPLQVVRNVRPAGFGANHNAAFERAAGVSYFVVVNPDIRISPQSWASFWDWMTRHPEVGACAPCVRNSAGDVEDHARPDPTFLSLFARRFLGQRRFAYDTVRPFAVDWVAGMFVAFRCADFARVGGFDARRFFMYFEDVDICRRLRGLGRDVWVHPGVTVVHEARRASHRDLRHLRWHLTSAFRYLVGV